LFFVTIFLQLTIAVGDYLPVQNDVTSVLTANADPITPESTPTVPPQATNQLSLSKSPVPQLSPPNSAPSSATEQVQELQPISIVVKPIVSSSKRVLKVSGADDHHSLSGGNQAQVSSSAFNTLNQYSRKQLC
jgi:hypothetical protein